MKCLTYLTLFAFLGYAFAIQTYYLDQRCGSTLNFPYYSLDAVRLKLTSNINYRSNMDCLMTVNTTSSKKFMLYFKSIAIESSVSCTRDWLEVLDGPNVNSRYVSGLSYRQCGFSISSQVFKTSGNSLTLRFQSDSSFQYSGFDMVITSYHTDNGLQIDFQRIVEDVRTQAIEQIQVDSSSTDTFQIMCRVNNVNQLSKITSLKVQYKTSANAKDFTDLAIMQNVEDDGTNTYRTPVLAPGAGSSWTPEGSFDTTNSNGRDSTLGVSRPVSSITCSNAVEYRCQLAYTKPDYDSDTGIISKELDVQDSDANSQDNTGAATAGSGSAGVIAGAVIGALVAIVIIVLLVYFLWYRRRSAGDDYTTKEEQGASNPNLAPNALYSVPDKKGHENRGLDEPHESSRHHHRYDNVNDGYERNGRKNHAMDRDDDDDYHSRDGSPSFGHSNHMGIDPVHGSIGTGV